MPLPLTIGDVSERVSIMSPNTQIWGISCAQTAIIPMNSVIDASAAASSTKVFNMPASSIGTYEERCSHFVPKESIG